MTVHYDVDKIERELRAVIAAAPLPIEIQPHMLVKLRNVELTVALTRTFFGELNRGTDKRTIMAAVANSVAEFVNTVASGSAQDSEDRKRCFMEFQMIMGDMLLQVFGRHGFSGGKITVTGERGGHA